MLFLMSKNTHTHTHTHIYSILFTHYTQTYARIKKYLILY